MNKENNEAQIILTFQALKRDPTLSLKKVASTYSVFFNTLSYRKQNRILKHNCISKSWKFIDIKKKAIIQRVFELDSQEFSPQISIVKDITN